MAQALNAGVPDVLETLAQLPNDEVFTPPYLVREMLDLFPNSVWSNPSYRWLDPATKSGSFLREAYKKLMHGLVDWEPNPKLRREHILRNMLFGASITQLTGEISRRSLYQSIDATGNSVIDPSIENVVVNMNSPEGNVSYVPTDHLFQKGMCIICRAPEKLVRERRENFAYSFIHGTYPTKDLENMKFDVILGNPPYQIGMDDAEGNRTTNVTPLYNMFVEKAFSLRPRYVLMITPSRWFAAGKGLNEFRASMLANRGIRAIVDFPNAAEVFPGVEIKGGVSYFLWDANYDGDCEFSTSIDGQIQSSAFRDLREGEGVLVRDNFASTIVKKVTRTPFVNGTLAQIVSASDPFGQSIKSNFSGSEPEYFQGSIPLIFVSKIGYVKPEILERNHDLINRWKVLLPKAYNGGEHQTGHAIYGEPIAVAPGSACTPTYLIAGHFDNAIETENYAKYLTTKFCRFLVSQRKISQHMTSGVFQFVPALDFSRSWSDEELYKEFGLDKEEIAYIERAVSARGWIDSLDSPTPFTHLPGGRKFRPEYTAEQSDESEVDE